MKGVLFVVLATTSGSEKAIKFDGRANGHRAALQCSEGKTDPSLPENANSELLASD